MRKEFYRYTLPHFQQSGQAYFITWSLKDAVPKKALKRYSDKLNELRLQIKSYGAAGAVVSPGAAVSEPLIHKMNEEYADRNPHHPNSSSLLLMYCKC